MTKGGKLGTITVGSGLNPTYSWSGTTASGVYVARVDVLPSGVWGFTTFGGSTIESPVHHGTVPIGGIPLQTAALEPTLTAGVRYRVTVYLTDSRSAQMEFTR